MISETCLSPNSIKCALRTMINFVIVRITLPLLISFLILQTTGAQATPWSLTVVDQNDQPVQARVRVVPRSNREPLFLETDAAGRLAGDIKLPKEPKTGDSLAHVFIYAPGHAPAGGALRVGDNRVKLGVARTVTGRVVGPDGQPLPNIAVQIMNVYDRVDDYEKATLENSVNFNPAEREKPWFTAKTDAEGRYEIHNMPGQGTANIKVSDPLWQDIYVRLDLTEGQNAPELTTRPAARLSGRVLHKDGAPAAGRSVYISSGETNVWTETDADGRYLLGGLIAGNFTIRVTSSPKGAPGVAPLTEATAIIGTETKVPDIRLVEGALVEIKTVPAVSGGSFYFRNEDLAFDQSGVNQEAEEGIVRARLHPGKYRLTISQPPTGWIAAKDWPANGVMIEAEEGKTGTTEIHFIPALTLAGTAQDEAGNPLADVSLSAREYVRVLTDERGGFMMGDLQPGEVKLTAGPEWEVVQPKTIQLPRAEPIVVTLKKVSMVPLRGRIINSQGAPIENATVDVSWTVPYNDRGTFSSQRKRVRSGRDGRFEAPSVLADSEITIKAGKSKHRFVRGGELTIARTIQAIDGARIPNPNAEYAVSDIVLVSLEREATGRVLDAGGKPVANAIVAALGGGQDEDGAGPRNIARTDAAGRFKLIDLPEGELGFVAGAGDGFAEIRSSGSELPDMTLQAQTRPTRDLPLARATVLRLIAESNESYYAYTTLPNVLAPYDMDAAREATKAMERDGKKQPDAPGLALYALIRSDPETARKVVPTQLAELEGGAGNYWYVSLLAQISQLIPQPEQETLPGEAADAAALRTWVRRQFIQQRDKLAALKPEADNDFSTAASLAAMSIISARLGEADAEKWAQSAIQVATRIDTAQAQKGEHGGAAAAVVEGLAEGGVGLVEKILEAVPPEERANALGQAIPVLAKNDLPGALRLLELLPAQVKPVQRNILNADPQWAFGLAAKAIIRRMGERDAVSALALARRVTVDSHRPEVLALAARLQPKAEAAALYREAFDLASQSRDRGLRQDVAVVAIALSADTAVSDELLAKMEDVFFDPTRWSMGNEPSVLTFYQARTQPGRARAWLEWKWARAQNATSDMNWPMGLKEVAMAMSAVDAGRALEMARSIPPRRKADGVEDYTWRWEAQRKIAQYLAATETARRGLNYSRWGASDTWTPGEDSGW